MRKLLVRLVRQSPAMIVAMLALFVALTGTAVATTSVLIGSAQIRNNSITGVDVKNRSLRPIDFRGSVRGPRGLRGLTGATGATGAQGIQGPPGTPNPNADKLDGHDADGLTRTARANGVLFPAGSVPLTPCGAFADIVTLSITAPGAGFVRVSSSVTTRNTGAGGTVSARLAGSSGETSPQVFGTAGNGAGQAILVELNAVWVFPVGAAGAFTVTLQACSFAAGADAFNGHLTAIFSPFGSTGTGTLSTPATARAATSRDPSAS